MVKKSSVGEREGFLLIFILLQFIHVSLCSNWAQVTGSREQNVARNRFPSAVHPHWQPRFGHAIIKFVNISVFNDYGTVVLFGGDAYDANSETDGGLAVPNLLDYSWGGGYKNDVWKMSTADWQVLPDQTGWKSKFGQKVPRTWSTATWTLMTAGLLPPPRVTYDNWIICEKYFTNVKYAQLRASAGCGGNTTSQVMWSPRRHHGAISFKGYMYVLGGRARELVEFSEYESIGGIIGARVKDVDTGLAASQQRLTTQREASVVKSDVWRSQDGVHWTLVTPGCKAPQSLLVPDGNTREGKHGQQIHACKSDSDCYGAEKCDLVKLTCVCSMWTSREQHAVTVYGDYMYVTGGYASFLYSKKSDCGPYPCGDTDASSYRYSMSDVWRSADGNVWELVTEAAQFPGRGGHQMLALPDVNGVPYLWIFGGRGVDNTGLTPALYYFNDIWTSPLTSGNPLVWTALALPSLSNTSNTSTSMPWTARVSHTVTLDAASASNEGVRTLVLVGGKQYDGAPLSDVWTWRLDDANSTWIQDYTPSALYSTVFKGVAGYFNNSPLVTQYLTPTSDISLLQRYWVPSYPIDPPGRPLEERVYLSNDTVNQMRSVGINTINDLATADVYTILKLRGFDIPEVPLSKRLTVTNVCDYRALAIAFVNKCSLTTALDRYYSEGQMPWNVVNVFDGPVPNVPQAAWHGVNYSARISAEAMPSQAQIIANWDGCTHLSTFADSGYHLPNVPGIGLVSQVAAIRDPFRELENLQCKQVPGPRFDHAAISFQERIFIFGGKSNESQALADGWYRDSDIPNAYINNKPSTWTSQSSFSFTADKPGCYFEYRIWDPANYRLIREWTPVVYQTDVAWMDSRMNGPGDGLYAMYVRAVDPAGNRDVYYMEGRNVYTWVYVSPIPWDIIFGAIGGFLGLCILIYIEYRRRRKKAAMERYALKRMRRKFKAMKKDAEDQGTDWRTLYEESKQESAAVKRKKMLKRARDANKDRLDKDAARRDKEKDAIKAKMKEKKELVRKKRLNDGGQYGFGERTDDDLEAGPNPRRPIAAIEDVEAPSRIKKSKERRKKPGGFQLKEYEENVLGDAVEAPPAEDGAGIKKRNKVANKRTKDFKLGDQSPERGQPPGGDNPKEK